MTRRTSDENPCGQGFSRSVPSSVSCGYLPYSRQKCQKFARNHPQRYPGIFQAFVQERYQAESHSNQTSRCDEPHRRQPSDLGCVLVPHGTRVSRSGTRNELQLIHFSAATDPQGADRMTHRPRALAPIDSSTQFPWSCLSRPAHSVIAMTNVSARIWSLTRLRQM
jgi:hypothetical protein